MIKDILAKVIYNTQISRNYWRIGLKTGWSRFNPGQFVMLRIPDNSVLVRRPFSIARPVDDDAVEVVYKVVGPGTRVIRSLGDIDHIYVLGPLGEGFTPPKKGKKVVLVAGGFGMAPFLGFLPILKKNASEINFYYGGKTLEDILFLDEFRGEGVGINISTEDGGLGHKGLVTELLSKDIDNYSKNSVIYCCGPSGLIQRVVDMAKERDLEGEVSAESYMGCGIGVCLGCAVKTKDGYKKACKDGPVFQISEII